MFWDVWNVIGKVFAGIAAVYAVVFIACTAVFLDNGALPGWLMTSLFVASAVAIGLVVATFVLALFVPD